jgi:predicted helicase
VHGDWLSQRNDVFESFIPMGDKDNKLQKSFFKSFYSRGLATARDAYCYNSSKMNIVSTMNEFIDFYEKQRTKFNELLKSDTSVKLESFIDFNTTKVTWNRGLKNDLLRNTQILFNEESVRVGLYRPFFKQHLYFARELNDMVYQIPKLFPNPSLHNLVICVSANYKDGSVLIADSIPDLHFNGDTQAFPLYYYEERQKSSPTLFDAAGENEFIRRDGVSDFILERAKKQYGKNVSKEDIFYYVYGILHSPDYRIAFANDLKKMLPRVPLVEDVRDFWKFSKSGRQLADLHINYENVDEHPDVMVNYLGKTNFNPQTVDSSYYRVEKMRFPKKGKKDTIIYNSKITISNIPGKAYQYVVNGKSAIEWIMERYAVTTHKASGIKNDPNDWANEVGNPRYILDLLLSIINVSVQTVDIVNELPKLEFLQD